MNRDPNQLFSEKWTALVPLKRAGHKARLRSTLSTPQRARLARWMWARTLAALRASGPVGEIRLLGAPADWAPEGVIWKPDLQPGLNAALQPEVDRCIARGQPFFVLFPDLPFIDPAAIDALLDLAKGTDLVLASDGAGQGTNALACAHPLPLRLAYGPNSFVTHLERAQAAGWRVRVLHHEALARDLDTPADWRALAPRLRALGFSPEASFAR